MKCTRSEYQEYTHFMYLFEVGSCNSEAAFRKLSTIIHNVLGLNCERFNAFVKSATRLLGSKHDFEFPDVNRMQIRIEYPGHINRIENQRFRIPVSKR